MKLTIYGPGMRGKHGFHVHKAGCVHGKQPQYARIDTLEMDAATRMDVLKMFYADQAEDNGAPLSDYVGEFNFAPCVTIE